MTQTEARRRAKELGGIAVSARPRFDSGGAFAGWNTGGWPGRKGKTWIVMALDRRTVLDDRRTPGDEIPDGRMATL